MNIDKKLALTKAIAEAGLTDLAHEAGMKILDYTDSVLSEFITQDPDMLQMKADVRLLAKETCNVLILGESGTGKDIIARALHGNRSGEFVAINCAGIPNELLEGEFFGATKGSYTGCHQDKVGLIEIANNGTLFLDEIGDMPLLLQSKLLKFLDSHKYRRVGDTKERDSNCRIVSATNQNIQSLIDECKFRLDLYYRLNDWLINIKPLRERLMDVLAIAEHYDCECPTAIQWPGNIRQLIHAINNIKLRKKMFPEGGTKVAI